MSVSNVLELLVVAVLVILSANFLVPGVRYQIRVMRSRNWPVASGAVQKGEILQSGATKYVHLPFRSLLGYAYNVNNSPYCGVFVLAAEDRDVAEKLQRQAEGKPVSVKYNPKHPEISVLVERELLGRRIMQEPMWLDWS